MPFRDMEVNTKEFVKGLKLAPSSSCCTERLVGT